MSLSYHPNRININKPHIIQKGWGEEIVIANNGVYCGKILKYTKPSKSSGHFHLKKMETFFVVRGFFKLTVIDPETAKSTTYSFLPGMTAEILPGVYHQLEAMEPGEIFEVSTEHDDNDVYRIASGASQERNK